MTAEPTLLWLRRDLRLSDHAALIASAGEGPVIPVYVLDDETPGERRMGGASRWWLHHSLAALDKALRGKGSRLILRRGIAADVLAGLAAETGSKRVHCLRHYEPWWRDAEQAVAAVLDLAAHDGNYLAPPGTITTGSGQPYKIYTPFWRALGEQMPPPPPAPAPQAIAAPPRWPTGDALDDWALLPTRPDWATGFAEEWTPGEDGAQRRLADFLDHADTYDTGRNLPSDELTSRLSPHLHHGEISPATIWHRVSQAHSGTTTYLKEIAWRDYAQNVILQYPDYARRNGRPDLDTLAWRSGPAADADLRAWQQGRTGYPIVDAGMRQLWASGWMHNRVRMITASFLTKHLLIDWRRGEEWFWDCLCCADYGSNTVNWQWTAGTGIDANMFSRIMAPLTQSVKFDAAGYMRQWVPELAALDDESIHDPDAFGCRPSGYPAKIIGHREGRERALAALKRAR